MREAAARKMVVDLHGCTIPRGWQRTWPNFLTCEAVLGSESYFYEPRYTQKAAELNTVLPFTRNAIGPMDAVIHNAGILSGPGVLLVNVVAPYLLTALIQRPRRLIYLSSGMHASASADLTGVDWSGRTSTGNYSDSKLFVTALAAAVARLWPDVISNAVNPGWVPTKMGGANAPDDLRLGQVTQTWLAVSQDAQALTTGGYWHHRHRQQPHPAVTDARFQDQLLDELARFTGTPLG